MERQAAHASSADRVVRNGLAAADRRRRARDASRQMWRAAPVAACIILAVAWLAHWRAWSPIVPAGSLCAGIVALAGYAFAGRRHRPVSDAAAAAIDADARMGGELRSAGWFAARDRRDSWAEFHLQKAAERLEGANWAQLYPARRARRAQLATAALTLGALTLTITIPERVDIRPVAAATHGMNGTALEGDMLMLPPELQRQLEELLAAIEGGDLATASTLANNAELRETLNRLGQGVDPQLLEALAHAMAANTGTPTTPIEEMTSLAERTRRAAESASLSREMQEALDRLADELQIAKPEQAGNNQGGHQSTAAAEQGENGQKSAAGGMQDLSIQFAKEANAGAGAGVIMMPGQDDQQAAGAPGAGVGGAGSQDTAGTAANIEAALKQEMIEASQDNPGENIDTEIRRQTEQGDATVAFTGSASGTFDRTRAAAPPPVPEARRSGVRSYFVRQPQ